MKARLRLSILGLVITIVTALSALHLHGVINEALEDVGERALLVAEQVKTYVIETTQRQAEAGDSFEETKKAWYVTISSDSVLPHILQKSLTQSKQVIEVVVVDENNTILASSNPSSAGRVHRPGRTFAEWQHQSLWRRVAQLIEAREDYAVTVPLGVAGNPRPIVTIRVFLSSVLLRASVLPRLKELATVMLLSLLMSILLAVIVSNLVSNSIESIGRNIDSISRGDTGPPAAETFESPELVDVQSKLAWLGRQFRGVREDVVHLRSNIDQLLRRLEEAVLVFGADGRLQMAGEPALRLLARKRTELAGATIEEIFPAWTPLGQSIQRANSARKPLRDEPVTLERPNLPASKLLLNVEPVDHGEGRVGTLVTLRDAESRHELRSQLDTAKRLSAISRLATGVAHEIKNPLNAMMLHLEIAAEKSRQGTPASTELDIIRGELFRLDRVVKTFLDFNRPVELRMGDCDVLEIVSQVANLVRPQGEARGVTVEVCASTGHAVIQGDHDLLSQCILNVAINGVEATRPGGSLRFDVDMDRGKNELVLSIADQGDGIPPEIQDKIFNLYFTTKESGSGVGLAVAYRVVQLHSGTITFESEPGKGTCFWIRFPVARVEEAAA